MRLAKRKEIKMKNTIQHFCETCPDNNNANLTPDTCIFDTCPTEVVNELKQFEAEQKENDIKIAKDLLNRSGYVVFKWNQVVIDEIAGQKVVRIECGGK
jgi:hypothetical protein